MKIRIKLILRTEKFDANTWSDLLKLKSTIIQPTRFGHVEPLKHKIEDVDKAKEEVIALYEKYLEVHFKGKNKFWFSASANSLGLLMCGGELELKNKEHSKISEIVEFMQLFARNRQLLYGYFCSNEEYDARHKVVNGSAYGWEGVSMWNFMDYLPGLHWYTIIGKDLVDTIGEQKFQNLNNVVQTLKNNEALAFYLNNDITGLDKNLELLVELEERIGTSLFWRKNKEEGTCSHPESYKKFLKSFNRF